jgi:hypothetical protein
MLSFGVGAMLIASLGSHAHLGLATSTGTSNYAALEEKIKHYKIHPLLTLQ